MDKSKEKIETMFDEIAQSYDKLNHIFTLNIDIKWRQEIVKYILNKKWTIGNILDLASGTGELTTELIKLDAKRIFAADISKKMLDIQKNKITDHRLKLIQAEASNLPFENKYFDIVTIGFGIRNFEHLEESLREIKRVSKSGARLIVLEMFKSTGLKVKVFNIYFEKIMPFIGNKISKSKYAYSYLFKSVDNFLSVNDFVKICEKCGFQFEYAKNNFIGIVNTIYLLNK